MLEKHVETQKKNCTLINHYFFSYRPKAKVRKSGWVRKKGATTGKLSWLGYFKILSQRRYHSFKNEKKFKNKLTKAASYHKQTLDSWIYFLFFYFSLSGTFLNGN